MQNMKANTRVVNQVYNQKLIYSVNSTFFLYLWETTNLLTHLITLQYMVEVHSNVQN